MSIITKSLFAGTALAVLLTAPVFAQSADDAVSSTPGLRGDNAGIDTGDYNPLEIASDDGQTMTVSAPAGGAGADGNAGSSVSSGVNTGEPGDLPDFNDPSAWNTPDAFYRDGGEELAYTTTAENGAAGGSTGSAGSGVSSGVNTDNSAALPDFNDPTAWNIPGAFYRDGGDQDLAYTTTTADGAESAQTAGNGAGAASGPDYGRIEDPTAVVENNQSFDYGVWGYSGNESDVALGAAAASVALGNTASAMVTEDVSVQIENAQDLAGEVESQAQNYFGEAGPVTSVATTYGNSFTAEAQNADIGMESDQTVGAGKLRSRALIEAAEYAESATGTATTGANTAVIGSEEGYATLEANQANAALVDAIVEINAAQADVPAAVGTAVTVINNADLETYGDASLVGHQANSGDANAKVDINAQGAYAAIGTATLTGNNLNMINEGGVGLMGGAQSNSGDLFAQSVLDVGVFPGEASSNAVAVGNNASANTTGPSSGMNTHQNNSGDVIAQGLFTGDNGLTGMTSATAYGNAATGTLCNCDGEMYAYNQQANTGSVRAHTYNLSNNAAVLTATSVAAGNTATYTVGSPE